MKELYWISVLGSLNVWAWLIAIVSFILVVVFVILYLCHENDQYSDPRPETLKKLFKRMAAVLAVSSVVSSLIPSTESMYVIYGVGTVVDYIQENPEAKQLPDKTVKFLNAVADKYISEQEAKTKETPNNEENKN